MTRVGWISDPLFLEHESRRKHPERPGRLRALDRMLDESGLRSILIPVPARDATRDDVLAAHDADHLELLVALDREGREVWIDGDTWLGPGSLTAALRAAGGVCGAVDAVHAGTVESAFVAVRPPGHHATRRAAMGFCLLNNVAIGACHALRLGYRRVGIVDWDVHHGNGTQEIFYANPDVFYGSVHQSPAYPGTGAATETGSGAGVGTTLNIPLPPGSGDAEFLSATALISRKLEVFGAEIVFVSAGYDAHARDPLGACRVTDRGFRRMAETVLETAQRVSRGNVVIVLEGGYDLDGLSGGVRRTVEAMVGNPE